VKLVVGFPTTQTPVLAAGLDGHPPQVAWLAAQSVIEPVPAQFNEKVADAQNPLQVSFCVIIVLFAWPAQVVDVVQV
jgi:hypothetical protein